MRDNWTPFKLFRIHFEAHYTGQVDTTVLPDIGTNILKYFTSSPKDVHSQTSQHKRNAVFCCYEAPRLTLCLQMFGLTGESHLSNFNGSKIRYKIQRLKTIDLYCKIIYIIWSSSPISINNFTCFISFVLLFFSVFFHNTLRLGIIVQDCWLAVAPLITTINRTVVHFLDSRNIDYEMLVPS